MGYVYGAQARKSAPAKMVDPRAVAELYRKAEETLKKAQLQADMILGEAQKEAEAAAGAPAVASPEQSTPAVGEAPDAVAVALESQRSRALIHELAREAVAQRVKELMEEAQQAADALRAEAMAEREKAEALRAEAAQMRVDAEEVRHEAQVLRENAEQSVEAAKQEIEAYGRQIIQQSEQEGAGLIEQAQQILANASDIELQAMELGRRQGYCIGLKEGRLKAKAFAQVKAWPNQPTQEEDFSAQPVQEQGTTDQSKESQP